MTHGELLLAATLLEEASERYTNHICNDLSEQAKNTLTQGEWDTLNKEYNDYNKTPEEYEPGKILSYDWLWMGYLAHKLKMRAESDPGHTALEFLRQEVISKDSDRKALSDKLANAEKIITSLNAKLSVYDSCFKQLNAGINSPREICAHVAEGEGSELRVYRIMAGAAMRELDRIVKEVSEVG